MRSNGRAFFQAWFEGNWVINDEHRSLTGKDQRSHLFASQQASSAPFSSVHPSRASPSVSAVPLLPISPSPPLWQLLISLAMDISYRKEPRTFEANSHK